MLDDIFVQLIFKYHPPKHDSQERIKCQEYDEFKEEKRTDKIPISTDLPTKIINQSLFVTDLINDQDQDDKIESLLRDKEDAADENNPGSHADVDGDWQFQINLQKGKNSKAAILKGY